MSELDGSKLPRNRREGPEHLESSLRVAFFLRCGPHQWAVDMSRSAFPVAEGALQGAPRAARRFFAQLWCTFGSKPDHRVQQAMRALRL